MHFCTTDRIDGLTAPALEKLFFAEHLNKAICADLGMHRTLVLRQEQEGELHRQVSIRPQREIPGVIAKLLGDRQVEYTEHMHVRFGTLRGTWRIVPGLFADKVKAWGTVQFSEVEGGCNRIVEGDVEVKIFGLGTLIEKFVVHDIERSFTRAAQFTNQQLRSGALVP
jgi:predicted DNA-binding protein with PD1-like motif